MGDTNETIADIAAEMRRAAVKVEARVGGKPNQFQRELIADLRKEADRLEAAWKREKAAIEADALAVGGIVAATAEKPSAVGALREALIDVVKRLEAYVGCDHHTFLPTATTCDGITSVGKCGKIENCAAIFKARAALSAPPRNCDRLDVDDAFEAFTFICDNTDCRDCPYKRNNKFGDKELCAMLFLYDNGNGGKEGGAK